MNPNERVLAILNHKPADRLPVDLWHTPGRVFMDYKTGVSGREDNQAPGPNRAAIAPSGGLLKNIQAGQAHYAEFGAAPLSAEAASSTIAGLRF